MDLMQYPGIPALNALPKEKRLDQFRATHRWLIAHEAEYQREHRRFWTSMGLGALGYALSALALGWAVTHGSMSREVFQRICMVGGAALGPGVWLLSWRYDRFRRAAIQLALASGAADPSPHQS